MSWVSEYVGLPQRDHGRDQRGVDCWGLIRLVYRQELGIVLPSYAADYVDPLEHAEIARIVNAAEACGPWHPVDQVRPFDLLLFRMGRYRSHIGCAVDAQRMLHVQGGDGSKLERFREGRWQHRLTGAFRHVERGVK